jgi:acyl dehydratase
MSVNRAVIGKWTQPRRYEVSEAVLQAYASSIGASSPVPLFGVVPAREPMLEAKRAALPSDIPAGVSVHGEHDFFLYRLIEPEMTVMTRAAVVGVHVMSAGTQVITKTETTLAGGEPVDVQYWTTLLRGLDLGLSYGERAPEKPPPTEAAPDAEVPAWVAPDLSTRYAEATGDKDAYVLDDEAARAAGFEGIILHGLCTLALATQGLLEHFDLEPTRLQRVGVRFTRPLLLGQQITTMIGKCRGTAAASCCNFDVADGTGQRVIRRGIARFRR